VLTIDIDKANNSKPIKDDYYLLQIIDNPDQSINDSVNSSMFENMENSKIANCFRLNVPTMLNQQIIEKKFQEEVKVEDYNLQKRRVC